jgi:hypothetical protein
MSLEALSTAGFGFAWACRFSVLLVPERRARDNRPMLNVINAIARLTFLELLRNRFLWLVLFVLAGALGLAEFLSRVALTEVSQFQSAVLAVTLRGAAVFLVSLFVVTSLTREIQDKRIEMVLSLPVSRGVFLAGKLAGFALATGLLGVLFALAAAVHAPVEQALIWAISLTAELWLVAALSVLCLFTFVQVPAAMATVLAFYVLGRSLVTLQLMGHGPMQLSQSPVHKLAVQFVDTIAWLMPDLHIFTRTEWLVYHDANWVDLMPVLGQTGIYLGVLISAAAFDLYRKNF